MTNLITYLSLGFAQHALIAATLVAIICGLVGPFVAARDMAFAVHGAAELSFTGAAAGLLIANDALGGALVGSLVVAAAIGLLGSRASERNSSIGVILAGGLGIGVFLLSFYHGFATEATNILFGQIFGVSATDIAVLSVIAVAILVVMGVHLPAAAVRLDRSRRRRRAGRERPAGRAACSSMCSSFTVTEAAQIVGTLLVLSLADHAGCRREPAALRSRADHRGVAIVIAVVAADGGLLLSLAIPDVKASFFITALSLVCYLFSRLWSASPIGRRGTRARSA